MVPPLDNKYYILSEQGVTNLVYHYSRLHSDPGFIEFAKDQINWYRNEHPHITFYVPDWFEEKCRMSQLRVKTIDRKNMFYIFVGKAVFK